MARFLANGPTADELERVKTQNAAGFMRGIERIGGFGGKSDVLASSQVFAGAPDHYKISLERVREATAGESAGRGARNGSRDGAYILEVHPFPQYETTATSGGPLASCPSRRAKPEVNFLNCSARR